MNAHFVLIKDIKICKKILSLLPYELVRPANNRCSCDTFGDVTGGLLPLLPSRRHSSTTRSGISFTFNSLHYFLLLHLRLVRMVRSAYYTAPIHSVIVLMLALAKRADSSSKRALRFGLHHSLFSRGSVVRKNVSLGVPLNQQLPPLLRFNEAFY